MWLLKLTAVFLFPMAPCIALYNLTILHTNDIHCRFEQANKLGGFCTEAEAAAGKCYGGIPRIVYMSKRIREENPNTVFLNAGDFFQGTIWYTIHKWKVVSHFANLINFTAVSLGNHEFDDGIDGLTPFLSESKFPVLAANIDTSNEPKIDGQVQKSTVVEVGGKLVGIIGFLTTDTPAISTTENVVFTDEVKGVQEEAQRLKSNGVDIIIAVGHAGYEKDIQIAKNVPEVDVVVGGHTNTFLWNETSPSLEKPEGPYPTVVEQPSGKKIPVIQAYAFGKYLGYLEVVFDDDGEIISTNGRPILLDHKVPQDPAILEELVPWRDQVDAVSKKAVGKTRVYLEGKRSVCRLEECNIGNLITDSFVNLFTKYAGPGQWTKAPIAVVNAGAIRASIDDQATDGAITFGGVRAVLPFPNTVDLVKIRGKDLKQVFERSVSVYNRSAGEEAFGGFLQVSGVRVTYDLAKPPGQRVTALKARCGHCKIPSYRNVEEGEIYDVAMSSYLAGGGDGYAAIKNRVEHQLTGVLDYDAMVEYISQNTPITTGLEGRIQFATDDQAIVCEKIADQEKTELPPPLPLPLLVLKAEEKLSQSLATA